MRDQRGVSLLEVLAVVSIMALCLALGLPSLGRIRNEGKAASGARYMASLFNDLRWQSVALRTHRGLYFESDHRGWRFRIVEDGNGNGLRTAEIRDGTDRVLAGPYRLEDAVQDAHLGFLEEFRIPRIPPRRGYIEDTRDPVCFGNTNIISFSPLGRSSSGTLYITDGVTAQFGVVLFGPSTRVRVWRFYPETMRWTL